MTEAAKLTAQDRIVLAVLLDEPASSYLVAERAGFSSMCRRENAARHCIKLSKMGLAIRMGKRSLPHWRITPAGRSALSAPIQPKGSAADG